MDAKRIVMTAVAMLVLAACGSSGPAMARVHGSFDIGPFSQGHCFSPGDQVTITDASGKVLATATLPLKPASKTVGGVSVDAYSWSATAPAESRYGVTAGGLPPYYVTGAQAQKGIDLSC